MRGTSSVTTGLSHILVRLISSNHFFGNFLLLFAGVKDHRPILGSRRPLPACSGRRVVHREKHLENFAISNNVQDQKLPAQLPHAPFHQNKLLHKWGFSLRLPHTRIPLSKRRLVLNIQPQDTRNSRRQASQSADSLRLVVVLIVDQENVLRYKGFQLEPLNHVFGELFGLIPSHRDRWK